MKTDERVKVQRAARAAAKAERELNQAIRSARDSGLSLRAIGVAAGLSHEHIRRVCA